MVIANHVLEHIDDDRQAMRELLRVLAPSGEREAHFNGPDHCRFYGLDFAGRLRDVGFGVEIFCLTPDLEVKFGLLPTEWLFIATRPQ